MDKLKRPPCSQDAEMIIIGSMLNSSDCVAAAIDILNPEDFYFSQHTVIYQTMKSLVKKGSPIDEIIVKEELQRTNQLKDAGDIVYLMDVSNYAQSYAYIDSYIKIVKDKSQLRQIIEASNRSAKLAIDEPHDVEDALDSIQKMFFEIGKGSLSGEFKLIKQVIDGTKSDSGVGFIQQVQDLQEKFANEGITGSHISGVKTEFLDLDKLINGMGNSNLIILAARPGMGKTTFALNIILNVAFKSNLPIGLFSLEMGADQLLWKLICCQAEIEATKLKNPNLLPMDFQSVVAAAGMLAEKTIIMEDPSSIKINQLKARARRMKETYNIGFMVIDYLQLITSDQKTNNRQEEVAGISRELKSLARELNIPIMCLAQLSRKVEERESKKPVMSDLRESGAIEQDADVILFINRRDYHDKMDKPGLAEIIVGKNRHGETGSATLVFEKETGRFKNSTFKMPESEDEQYEKQFNEKLKGW